LGCSKSWTAGSPFAFGTGFTNGLAAGSTTVATGVRVFQHLAGPGPYRSLLAKNLKLFGSDLFFPFLFRFLQHNRDVFFIFPLGCRPDVGFRSFPPNINPQYPPKTAEVFVP